MKHSKKQYGFTCPDCGQLLTQDKVLFGLPCKFNLPIANDKKLYISEKDLLSLAKRRWNSDRYTIKMGWREFLRYLGNSNNLDCPELKRLTYKDAEKIVKGFKGKPNPVYEPPIYDRICNCLGDHNEAKRLLQNLVGLYQGKKSFFLEVTRVENEKRLIGLHVYDGYSGEDKGIVDRSCCRCKKSIFSRAGAVRHSTVVFLEQKERSPGQPYILNLIWKDLPQYRDDTGCIRRVELIEPKKRYDPKHHLSSMTVEIFCGDESRLLTLALASSEHRDRSLTDEVCYFPDADAFVLCNMRLAGDCSDVCVKNREIANYAQLLQEWASKKRKGGGYVPMLLLYAEDGQGGAGNREEAIFPDDRFRAKKRSEDPKNSQELHQITRSDVFYTQLFFGTGSGAYRIDDAVRWILQVTGCVPIQGQTRIANYRVEPPICESVLATDQIKRSPDYWKVNRCDLAISEKDARSYLFDNAEGPRYYRHFRNIHQLEDHERKRKSAPKTPIGPESKPPIPETVTPVQDLDPRAWEEAESLIEKFDKKPKDSKYKVITFLIGNGFDRGVGLKSGYDDFYKLYLTPGSGYHPGDEKNQKFDDRGLVEVLNDARTMKKYNWADYEKGLGLHSQDKRYEDREARKRLMKQNDNFQAMFYKYLEQREEKMVFAMTGKKGEYDEGGKTKHARLKKVKGTMEHALKSFYENIGQDGSKKVAEAIKTNMINIFQDGKFVPIEQKRRYQFVCFNFSSVLDNCVAQIKDPVLEIGPVHHVHGSLKDRNSTKVMGVNDLGQMGPTFAYEDEDIRHLHKWRMMKFHGDQSQYETGVKMVWESDVIVLYGISLGETDKVWWQTIYQWLKEPAHQLVIYEYTEKEGSANSGKDKIQDKLADFKGMVCDESGKDDADWEKRKNQIHFAIGKEVHEKMFMMDLRIRPNEDDGKTVSAV